MRAAIEITELSKGYRDFQLRGINLTVPEGAVVGLIGQNGAGKSTLIKCILGLVKKDSGRVALPCAGDGSGHDVRRHIGYVPETLTFYEWMKVGRLIRFASAFYPGWDDAYASELLRRYELDPHKLVKHLSKGMLAKLALLVALAHKPPVLILDEPTSGLDPLMKHQFLQEVRRISHTGAAKAVLISSHILSEVERVADRVAVLRAGTLSRYEDTSVFLAGWSKIIFRPPHAGWLPPQQ